MRNDYAGVTTRFLRDDERLMLSDEKEMPLVLEATGNTDIAFLQSLLKNNSEQITRDIAQYGAVLLRGFAINSDEDFENTVLSIQGFRGISEAFMAEQGRIHVGKLKYVLHTNAVYKTGGTLYLGGFHSENYYTPDVPSHISFCCLKPSTVGGETGLVNMEKVFQHLDPALIDRLEKNNFFAAKWLVTDVAERYNIPVAAVEKICAQFDLPIAGKDHEKFILMYKPNIFVHPLTQKKSLEINLFELPTLNDAMRKCFANDYTGKTWFWHRFVWKLPAVIFKTIEIIYMSIASLYFSPKEAFNILLSKFQVYKATKKQHDLPVYDNVKVGSCFTEKDVKALAQLIRTYYCSCLWQKGDIILVDNLKTAHAGMPGAGPRLIRAMICNPIQMQYSNKQSGLLHCQNRLTETIGHYMAAGKLSTETNAKQGETVSSLVD